MTALTSATPTALAAAAAEADLAEIAPELAPDLREQLPRAMDVVARRLIGAVYREGLTGGPATTTWSGGQALLTAAAGGIVVRADRHAFDRIEVTEPVAADPARLLGRLLGPGRGAEAVQAELVDAAVNLALAYARRERADPVDPWAMGMDPDVRTVHLERWATEGHNLHPCGRTRLGWSVADLLAHDLESPVTAVGFVGVRRDLHLGDEIGPLLLDPADNPLDRARYALTPVHPWQLHRVIRDRYADLVAEGAIVPLDAELPALATAALRTLVVPGFGHSVKLSLDIQVTSTRRSISVASTRNGPALSALLEQLLPACGERFLLMHESAGSAGVTRTGDRDLSAILRSGLSTVLEPDEIAVPGSALYATSPLTGSAVVAELVDRTTHRDPRRWIAEYARVLLPPVLRLATRHGIGLEAHLQNCVPTFIGGNPRRIAIRDLAGMRVYRPRLAESLRLWPGSVIVAEDADVMRAKVAYTALQAHLAELILQLGRSHGLDEAAAWATVRSLVDEIYDELAAEPGLTERARADHAFLTAPTVPHKALLAMRLAAGQGRGGDLYVSVRNPLR